MYNVHIYRKRGNESEREIEREREGGIEIDRERKETDLWLFSPGTTRN